MAYFRELPVPLKELDADILEIFFDFANTYSEKAVQQSYLKKKHELESRPTAQMMKQLGYSYEDIVKMDLRDGTR
jgi:hypothetical protein